MGSPSRHHSLAHSPPWIRRGGCAAGADGVVGFTRWMRNGGGEMVLLGQHHPGASRHPSSSEDGSFFGNPVLYGNSRAPPLTPPLPHSPPWIRRGGCAAGADGVVGFTRWMRNGGGEMVFLGQHHPGASRHPSSSEEGSFFRQRPCSTETQERHHSLAHSPTPLLGIRRGGCANGADGVVRINRVDAPTAQTE